jgi:DNA-directed RNA polymerases I, II, and III subunit RPABC4
MSTQQTNGTDDLLDAGTAAPGADGRPSAASLADQMGAPVTYRCGDCNARVPLKRDDPVRCVQCGYRVLYKERTTRSVFLGSAREWWWRRRLTVGQGCAARGAVRTGRE